LETFFLGNLLVRWVVGWLEFNFPFQHKAISETTHKFLASIEETSIEEPKPTINFKNFPSLCVCITVYNCHT